MGAKKLTGEEKLAPWIERIWGDHENGKLAAEQYRKTWNLDDDVAWSEAEKSLVRAKEKKKLMSGPGELKGLTPLLEKRRWEYMIPDKAWKTQAVYDRILIYQTPQFNLVQARPDSVLYAPEITQDREMNSSPEGVIVSAGLKALDQLRSNGIDVGHHVAFAQNFLFKIRVDWTTDGEEFVGMLLAGDVVASYDLAEQLRSGDVIAAHTSPDREHLVEHYYVDGSGKEWVPLPGDVHMGDH